MTMIVLGQRVCNFRCISKMFAQDYVVKSGKWMTFVTLIKVSRVV